MGHWVLLWLGNCQSSAFGKSVKILLGQKKERPSFFDWFLVGDFVRSRSDKWSSAFIGSLPRVGEAAGQWGDGDRVWDGESSLSVIGSRCSTSAEIKVKIDFFVGNQWQSGYVDIHPNREDFSVCLSSVFSLLLSTGCLCAGLIKWDELGLLYRDNYFLAGRPGPIQPPGRNSTKSSSLQDGEQAHHHQQQIIGELLWHSAPLD